MNDQLEIVFSRDVGIGWDAGYDKTFMATGIWFDDIELDLDTLARSYEVPMHLAQIVACFSKTKPEHNEAYRLTFNESKMEGNIAAPGISKTHLCHEFKKDCAMLHTAGYRYVWVEYKDE
jgi:hypothetical protein